MYINTDSMRQRLFIFLDDFVKNMDIKSIISEEYFINTISYLIDYINVDNKEKTKYQYNLIVKILEPCLKKISGLYSLIKKMLKAFFILI